jgi:hypothetical protein
MIVGHLRRISPLLTHDHEAAVRGAADWEKMPRQKGHSRVAYPKACDHDPRYPHRRPWPFFPCSGSRPAHAGAGAKRPPGWHQSGLSAGPRRRGAVLLGSPGLFAGFQAASGGAATALAARSVVANLAKKAP